MTYSASARRSAHGQHMVLGEWGEQLATELLTRLGYRIIERRWASERGEIDIIATHGRWLIAVEVKSKRGTDFGHADEALTPQQLRRIQRSLAGYQSADYARWRWYSLRVDLLALTFRPGGRKPLARLLRDVS